MRRLGGLLGVVLLAPLLVSCGSGSDSSSDSGSGYHPYTQTTLPDALVAAYQRAGSVRMVIDGGPVHVETRMRFGESGVTALDMSVRYPRTLEVIAVDHKVYERGSDDQKYTELPPDVGDKLLAQFAAGTPDQMAEDMRDATDTLDYVGPQEVLGETLYEYDVVLDADYLAREWAARNPGSEPPEGPVSYELLLDEDDNLTQVTMDIAGQEVQIQMLDWGEPMRIEAPPRSQVVPYTGQPV